MSTLPLKPDICERDWGDCWLKKTALLPARLPTEARGAEEKISPRSRNFLVRRESGGDKKSQPKLGLSWSEEHRAD